MKIKLLTSIATIEASHATGEVIEMTDDDAKAMIDAGYAEAVEAPKKKAGR